MMEDSEMTLYEYVGKLEPEHQARKEYEELYNRMMRLEQYAADTLKGKRGGLTRTPIIVESRECRGGRKLRPATPKPEGVFPPPQKE